MRDILNEMRMPGRKKERTRKGKKYERRTEKR
jgi:hypothetical protein